MAAPHTSGAPIALGSERVAAVASLPAAVTLGVMQAWRRKGPETRASSEAVATASLSGLHGNGAGSSAWPCHARRRSKGPQRAASTVRDVRAETALALGLGLRKLGASTSAEVAGPSKQRAENHA